MSVGEGVGAAFGLRRGMVGKHFCDSRNAEVIPRIPEIRDMK